MRTRSLPSFALILLALAAGGPACAQQEGRASATATPPDSVPVRAERSRLLGAPNAPVTIVEVSDFQCPFCRQFATETFAALDSAYLQTGKARLVFVSYPLPNHPLGWIAAEAAFCAGAQGRFWPMHDRLFATQREWTAATEPARVFAAQAAALGLDTLAFRDCTDNDRVAPVILGDLLQAAQAGINGTPTLILMANKDGSQARKVLVGAQPFETLSREIDALLAGGNSAPKR